MNHLIDNSDGIEIVGLHIGCYLSTSFLSIISTVNSIDKKYRTHNDRIIIE